MKTFLATTAIASVMALPLAAQTVTVETPSVGAEVGAEVSVEGDAKLKTAEAGAGAGAAAGASMSAGDEVGAEFGLAGNIIGQRVYDANDEWIGEVADVVEADGKTWLIVDVGGFLGIGEKPVALDLAEFEITQNTENAEEAKIIVSVDLTQEQLEAMPTYDMALGTDADADVDADAEVGTDMAAGTALAPEAGVDAEAEASTDLAAGTDLTPGAEATLEAETDVAAEITGKRVYDANDEWIGEISEVVVADGKSWAIIDVGGFLGIGEKPVAMDVSELEIVAEQGDGSGNVKISVRQTKAELEAMPTYEKM